MFKRNQAQQNKAKQKERERTNKQTEGRETYN
jgi:hypothetical protein